MWSSSDTGSIYPTTLLPSPYFSRCRFLSPSLSSPRLSFSSAFFSSKGRLPPLRRPRLIFHFQITVAPSCFTTPPLLSFFIVLRDKHNRWKLKHNGHVDIQEAEASERLWPLWCSNEKGHHSFPTSNCLALISDPRLKASLRQFIARSLAQTRVCVYKATCMNTSTHVCALAYIQICDVNIHTLCTYSVYNKRTTFTFKPAALSLNHFMSVLLAHICIHTLDRLCSHLYPMPSG